MENQVSNEKVIDVLLGEYSAVRQELRMLLGSMDTNLNFFVVVIGALVAAAAHLQDQKVLFAIPSVIAFFAVGQFFRATSTNVLGIYCQALEKRLRQSCGSNRVVMNWEGSPLWQVVGAPTGAVSIGFGFLFLAALGAFAFFAYRAFFWWRPSIIIHVGELVFLIAYGRSAARWNTQAKREKWVNFLLRPAETSPPPGLSPEVTLHKPRI
jgi:hypothetical protein